MSQPSLSVAMCTYNGSRYLGEQLQSIALQTLAPAEVVICDDGSTDRTVEIAQEFARRLPLRLLRNPATLGCTRNFEQAIGLCRSDIIVLSDQDDIWQPNKLAAIATAFADQPDAGYAFSDAETINEHGHLLDFSLWDMVGFAPGLFTPSRQVALLLKRNLVTGAAMAFRGSLRRLLLPIPAAWGHDYWIALLGSIFSFGVPISEKLFLYRRHLAQEMGCGRSTFLQRVRESLQVPPDYGSKAARIAELHARVIACSRLYPCPPGHLQLIMEKEAHLKQRALIRAARGSARIARLLNEAASGRYRRFSFSWSSMIRDLMTSATPPR